MELAFVRQRFGDVIDFGPCLVGANLNMLVLRGYGRMDQVAAISGPDVFDMVDNPTGTQRALKEKHARECLGYAMDADALPPEDDPRFFPELLLNARDAAVVEIYDLENPGELVDLDSFTELSEVEVPLVGLRVRVSDMEYPKKTKSPQISRVDGNHRLHGTDELLETASSGDGQPLDRDFPFVSFALLLELTDSQEAKLFRDINGEHEGMEVAHLDAIKVRITDPQELREDPRFRPLWIANELAQRGRAFEGMVFFGGEKTGVKKGGLMPPIKINSLKSTIHQQLKSAPSVAAHFKSDPDVLLGIVDNFWKAVRSVFPEAWADRRDYILLQAIGLGAFAKFGGALMERGFEEGAVDQEDFERYLAPVSKAVTLERAAYPGIAGAGGQQYIADMLLEAAEPDAVKIEKIKQKFKKKPSADEALGLEMRDLTE